MQPLISVVINNYNYAEYISEAINSVLNQTYKNFELIIVDDGSTDNSQSIISNYKEKYPKKIITVFKENGGQASALNKGFQFCKGEIVCFLDSDDYWYPNKLERVVKYYPDADIIEHSLIRTNNTCRWFPKKIGAHTNFVEKSIFVDFSETSGLSFKKELLDKVFPIPENQLRLSADAYMFCASLFVTDKIETIREVLGYYRIHGNNGWYGNQNIDYDIFEIVAKLINVKFNLSQNKQISRGIKRIEQMVNKLNINQDLRYAIYGAGTVGDIVLTHIKKNKGLIKFFIQTNVSKKNDYKNGLPIYSLDELLIKINEVDRIIIASSRQQEIMLEIEKREIDKSKIITLDLYFDFINY